jgi:hypothetical protein
MSALALLACATTIAPVLAQPGDPAADAPIVAQSKDVPRVERSRREICYDPQPRVACKQRCESARAQCSLDIPACGEQLAKCVSACPPMICSRGRAR